MPEFRLVDLTVDDSMLLPVADEARIGVDTEFMRERTYFAELSLLQIATVSQIFCADPLGRQGNGPAPSDAFWETIMRPEWVIHSGRQDIEVVFQASGRMPRAVFDTQIAAALLGYQPQIGYAGLVSELFGAALDKSHTRANWSKRPLADELLRYAAEDVQFLLPARDALTDRLEQKGRMEWAVEDSRDLLDTSLYETDPAAAVERLKSARNLRGRARAAATALAEWRETEALRRNLPRQWIMRDSTLIDLAVSAPASMSALRRIDGMADKTVDRVGKKLLEIVADATHDESGYEPPARPDEHQKSALKKMQGIVAACADSLGIAAELIAPKKELSAAMLGRRDLRVFRGWRLGLVGEALLGILDAG
jgi:ribonuclease D